MAEHHALGGIPRPTAELGTTHLVIEVEYRQRLKDGLRHAALKGVRPEKEPGVIRALSPQHARPFLTLFLTLLSIPAIRFATSLACIAATILDASVRRA